jgi:glycosyltransferase involved in cell wall biosynthesis
MRVALLTNILAPYRLPVFRELAKTPGWTLRVMLCARSEFDRSWRVDEGGLDVEIVRSLSFRRRIRTRGQAAAYQIVTVHLPIGLLAALLRFVPDVVVSAELGARTLLALLCCKLLGVPLVIWSYHSRVSATSAGTLRRGLRRLILRQADAVIGMGTQSREVLAGLGVPAERLFDAPNVHDHDAGARILARRDALARHRALLESHGCRERIALVVGRLVPVKGIINLIKAWEQQPSDVRADWTLLFVGSGPLATLIDEASVAQEEGEIVRVPAVQPSEVIPFYASAQLLVFSTLGDNWGLVVNEAFACGVPALVSRFAGCADDLVEPGENGWIFDPTDGEEFLRSLGVALTSPDLRLLGKRARETAARFRPEIMAADFRRAIRHAATPAPPHRSPAAAPGSDRG